MSPGSDMTLEKSLKPHILFSQLQNWNADNTKHLLWESDENRVKVLYIVLYSVVLFWVSYYL